MRVTFDGWQRVVVVHDHDVVPVKSDADGRWMPMSNRRSILWSDDMTAFGELENLQLNGNFLVRFEFTEAELRNWLTRYFESDPERAFDLVADVQAKTIKNLTNNTVND